MGAELGATTSIFPSHEITLAFLKAQAERRTGRKSCLNADAEYDEIIDIDLCELTPDGSMPAYAR
jgi:aconitate hydratase